MNIHQQLRLWIIRVLITKLDVVFWELKMNWGVSQPRRDAAVKSAANKHLLPLLSLVHRKFYFHECSHRQWETVRSPQRWKNQNTVCWLMLFLVKTHTHTHMHTHTHTHTHTHACTHTHTHMHTYSHTHHAHAQFLTLCVNTNRMCLYVFYTSHINTLSSDPTHKFFPVTPHTATENPGFWLAVGWPLTSLVFLTLRQQDTWLCVVLVTCQV